MEYGPEPHDGRAVFVADPGNDKILCSPLRLRDEPTALTPFDAYRVIMLKEIDAAMLGNYLIYKDQQPKWQSLEESAAND